MSTPMATTPEVTATLSPTPTPTPSASQTPTPTLTPEVTSTQSPTPTEPEASLMLMAVESGEHNWHYEYDGAGNLLSDGTTSYTYDTANRASSITAAGVTTTYKYNGDGDRIEQKVGEVTTTYDLDTATPLTMLLAETTGGQTTCYWHGLDTLVQSTARISSISRMTAWDR